MTDNAQSLDAARAVESLLNAARDLMNDAESIATAAGGLTWIAKSIRERVESLNGELLVEISALIEVLKKRQAEKSEPKS